jgi:hypothetical protein
MEPVTIQDTKWTILQMTQGPKHQHVKLRGLSGLPTKSIQSERYSRSLEKHDLPTQVRKFKCTLMPKIWIPKLCASMIASNWTCRIPNLGQGARRCGPRNNCCADKSKRRQIIFHGRFGILSLFTKKPMNTKVGDNFVEDNLDTEFALFGVRTWGIWRRQGRAANQEKFGRCWVYGNQIRFSPKEDLVQGKLEDAPRLPKGINTTPWAPKEGGSIHPFIREPPTQTKGTGRKPTAAASPRVA